MDYPIRWEVEFVLRGLRAGFHIGFEPGDEELPPAVQRLGEVQKAAKRHVAHLRKWLHKELDLTRVAEVQLDDIPEWARVHPVHVVPKASSEQDANGEAILDYRVVNDLSAGDGCVNGGISRKDCSLRYGTVMHAMYAIISFAARFGNCGVLSKMDWSSAFRRLAVHPDSYYYNVFSVDGKFYIDCAVCFGCRSSPFIFGLIAKLSQWIYQKNIEAELSSSFFFLTHLLDDQLLVCADQTASDVATPIMFDTAKRLGIPLSADSKQIFGKTEGPYLGVQLNLRTMQFGLPPDKELDFTSRMRTLATSSRVRVKELRRCIGKLVWFGSLVHGSKPFLSELFALQRGCRTKMGDKFQCVGAPVRSAAAAWLEYYRRFPTASMFVPNHHLNEPPVLLATGDAAGGEKPTDGAGAYAPDGSYTSIVWPEEWRVTSPAQNEADPSFLNGPNLSATKLSSTLQEIVPLCCALCLWGPPLAGHTVVYRTDCKNLTFLMGHKFWSRTPAVNRLVILVLRMAADAGIRLVVQWQSREMPDAKLADDLSRNDFSQFQVRFRELYMREPGPALGMPPSILAEIFRSLTK